MILFYLKTTLVLAVTVTLAPFYFVVLLILYPWRHSIGPVLVQFYSRICLFIYRVRIEQVKNYRRFKEKRRGFLIISNHASFLDIFVLSALFGSVFVSKAEVMAYPIIGQIAWLMGVIFIDRGSSREKLKVLKTIANGYSDRVVAVFPQGTTSRIEEKLPFRRGIFKTPELNPDIALLPVTLYYKEDADIAWNKPQTFRENIVRVCAQKSIHLKVTVHGPVTIRDYRGKGSPQICKMVEKTILGPLKKKY